MALSDFLPSAADSAAVPSTLELDGEFITRWPGIWELCTTPLGLDKKRRELSTIVLYVDGASWKIRLSERNLRMDLWSGAPTLLGAMDALEAALHQQPVAWRSQGPTHGRK